MLVNLKNISDLRKWKRDKQNVYIGRETAVFEESKWANPYKISQTSSREQVLLLFEQYIRGNSVLLEEIVHLRGKNLGCWCSPKLCHGNIIEQILQEITSGEQQCMDNQKVMATANNTTNVNVHITEHVTTPTTVISSANVYTPSFPHTSVIFSPQQKGPKTRSSTGTNVKSTHMKLRVSPDKSLQVLETDASTIANATKVAQSPKTPPLAPVTCDPVPTSNSSSQVISSGLPITFTTSPSFVSELTNINQANRRQEQVIDISHLMKRIEALEADAQDQTMYNLLQNDKIRQLEKRVVKLEGELMQVNARFCVRDHVVEALQGEIHRLQQYTRRYSVVVAGIEKKKDETPESLREEVIKLVADVNSTSKEPDIDKFHRNGRVYNGNEQEIIVRFKSHAAKEAFYRARKTLPASRRGIKIRPSLSPNQKNLLRDAQSLVEEFSLNEEIVNPVEYVFANIHGEIQAKMKKKFRGSPFISFNSLKELSCRLQEAQAVKETNDYFHEVSSRYDTHSGPQNQLSETEDVDDMGFGDL